MGAIGILTEWLVGITGVLFTGRSLWQMFRPTDNLKVTNKSTGKSVIINTKADAKEGRKLVELMAK
jgi:hypothetical protein